MKVLTVPASPLDHRVTIAEVPGLFPDGTQAVRFTVHENDLGAFCREARVNPARLNLEAQEFLADVNNDRVDKFNFYAEKSGKVYKTLDDFAKGEKLPREKVLEAFNA